MHSKTLIAYTCTIQLFFFFQADPVKELLTRFMGQQEAENRKTLNVDSVPLDESGLRDLLVHLLFYMMMMIISLFTPQMFRVAYAANIYEYLPTQP